jgi:hypothetical protein
MFACVWVNYTASVQGTTIREVLCENCGEKYHYRLSRVAYGYVHAPYDIGGSTAKKRAMERAKQRLRRKLDEDVDPVPCPECGWYQWAMVPLLRRSRLRWMRPLALWSLVAVLVPFTIGVVGVINARTPSEAPAWTNYAWVAAGLVILLCPAIYILRWVLNLFYDPNRSIEQRERILRGRAVALTPEEVEDLKRQQG